MTYTVEFLNRRKKKEIVTADTERKAVAIGKTWSIRENFNIYQEGKLIAIFKDGRKEF